MQNACARARAGLRSMNVYTEAVTGCRLLQQTLFSKGRKTTASSHAVISLSSQYKTGVKHRACNPLPFPHRPPPPPSPQPPRLYRTSFWYLRSHSQGKAGAQRITSSCQPLPSCQKTLQTGGGGGERRGGGGRERRGGREGGGQREREREREREIPWFIISQTHSRQAWFNL